MSFDYSKISATALKLLTNFGSTVTLKRMSGNSVDPVTGAVIVGVDVSVTTTGVLRTYPDNAIDGSRILDSDRELVLSNEHQPLPSDKPIIAGEEWSIVNVTTAKPNGSDAIVYRVQVRR